MRFRTARPSVGLRLALRALLLAGAFLLTACSDTPTPTPIPISSPTPPPPPSSTPAPTAIPPTPAAQFSGDTIKIGVDMPLTSNDAANPDGVMIGQGAQLAIEQADAAGGVVIA